RARDHRDADACPGEHRADLLPAVLELELGESHHARDQLSHEGEGGLARRRLLAVGHRARFYRQTALHPRSPRGTRHRISTSWAVTAPRSCLGYPSPPVAKRRTSGIQRRSRASDEALGKRLGTPTTPTLDWRILGIGAFLLLGLVILLLVVLFGGSGPTDPGTTGTRQGDGGGTPIDQGRGGSGC